MILYRVLAWRAWAEWMFYQGYISMCGLIPIFNGNADSKIMIIFKYSKMNENCLWNFKTIGIFHLSSD